MNEIRYLELVWIVAAAGVGFGVAAVFSNYLHLSRRLFLVPYMLLASGLVYAFFAWNHVDVIAQGTTNWVWSLVATVLLGAFLVKNVFSQRDSERTHGWILMLDMLWTGVIYGCVDALLLSVLPVLAIWQAFSQVVWTGTWLDQIIIGALAMAASLLVTAAYHLGYPEYKGPQVAAPLIGNGIMSLGYLLTGNPGVAIVSHMAMHVAAVLHGPATASQLPPHYSARRAEAA